MKAGKSIYGQECQDRLGTRVRMVLVGGMGNREYLPTRNQEPLLKDSRLKSYASSGIQLGMQVIRMGRIHVKTLQAQQRLKQKTRVGRNWTNAFIAYFTTVASSAKRDLGKINGRFKDLLKHNLEDAERQVAEAK